MRSAKHHRVGIISMVAAVSLLVPTAARGGYEEDERVVREAMAQGLIEEHPFPLQEAWRKWVTTCGDLLSYRSNCIKRWEEMAEVVRMSEEQRAEAKALHERYVQVHEQFDRATTPRRRVLGRRKEQAEDAGNDELAKQLDRLRHVQTHQKLAIEGGASEDLIRLLTPQQVQAWHEHRVAKHAVHAIRKYVLKKKVGDRTLEERVGLTGEQKGQIETIAWKVAKEEFLPTVDHPEDVSAFAIYGEDQKRALAMAENEVYPQVVRAVLADAQRAALGGERALDLRPCTIELVDGRTVEGQLAVQFEMDDHLVVYSPRFATVRSFLKKHVHAVTVDGKREQMNPKRPLTAEDKELLGRITWPDEPPEKGRKPAYTTETWTPPKQLLVWANPGRSGRFGSPDNWVVNGSAAKTLDATEVWSGPSWHRNRGITMLNKDTDVLVPAATSDYQVRGRGEYLARHITVEPRAALNGKLKGAYGNLWIASAGRIDGGGNAYLRGVKDTFFIHGERHGDGPPATPEAFAELMDASKHFARKWVVRKDDPTASVSLIGTFRSGDETHWLRGITILEDDSVISVGARCVQTVGLHAKLVMRSGSILGKNGNQLYKNDMRIKGELLAGTPDEPITRNAYLGISIKDSKQSAANAQAKRFIDDAYVRGLTVAPMGRVRVHSADPAEAQLHVTWHGSEPAGDDGSSGVRYDQIPAAERTINVNLLGDQVLNDVVFDHVGKGDIRLLNPQVRRRWKRVGFGEHNTADAEAVFATVEPGEETQKQIAQWSKEASGAAEIRGFYSGMTLYTRNPGTPTIETPAGYYRRGSVVTVRLSNETEGLEMRYTVDGKDPSPNASLYKTPFTVTEDVVVKAAGFKDGKQYGDTVQARFRFAAPGEAEWSESRNPGRTSEGLAYRYFEGEWKTMPAFGSLKPVKTGVAPGLDIESAKQRGDKFAVVFEGYIDIRAKGPYNLHLSTGKADACRVFLDGRLIIDNDVQTLESVGLVGLAAGKHALRVEFVDGGWGEYVRMALRGLTESHKQTVTADMLSH